MHQALHEQEQLIGYVPGAETKPSEPIAVPRREAPADAMAPRFEELLRPSSTPLVDLRFLFEHGAADDPDGQEGLAELTARMVSDAGSEALTYAQVQRALYPLAAGFGAQVDKEMTVFSGTVHRDNLDRYYDIVASQLLDPAFRESDFERVKDQLINDIRVGLRANNDEELGKEVLYEMIYGPAHPYGHLTLGHAEAIAALTIDDVRSFYETHYRQPALTVGVAGDAPEPFLARMRADLASELPDELGSMQQQAVSSPKLAGTHVTLVNKETRAAAISFGFPIEVRRGHEDFVALYLARSYFGEHRSSNSHLFQRIREVRGMNYGDYAYIEYFPRGMYQFHPDPNLGRRHQIFQVWIRPVPPEQAHFALRLGLYELDRLIEEGISEEDFEATRNYLMKFTNVLTASQDRALGYDLDSSYYGTPEFVAYIREGLATLTRDDVNHAIRTHLDSEGMAVVVITPEAQSLADQLAADAASPMTYTVDQTVEVLAEDAVVESYPIKPDHVRVIEAADVFERHLFD